jgi:hypothetical protein
VISKTFISLPALTLIALTAGNVNADVVNLVGVDSGAFSTALETGEFNAQTNTFTFTLTNTSAVTQPGSTSTITSVGFDLPPIGNASPSGLNGFVGMQAPSLSSNFTFSDADLGSVPGFNTVLDFGFLTGINFDSGSVNLGLLPGESASFTVSGAGFAGLTEEDIVFAIFIAFENVPGVGSDVAALSTPSTVPEPSTLWLLGLGLAGLALGRRRKGAAY